MAPHFESEHQAFGDPVHQEPAQYEPQQHLDKETKHHFSPANSQRYCAEHGNSNDIAGHGHLSA